MGAEPESRYVRAACPSVLDCLSCGGFSGSLWAGSGLLSLSWLVALSALSSDVMLSLAWAGCFLLPLCGPLSASLCLPFYLRLFVSPSICVLAAIICCLSLWFSAVFRCSILFATTFFCPSTIFFSLWFSSVFLCDLLFSSCDLLFSFPAIFYFPFPGFRAGFYLALGFTQAGMNVRGFAPAGFVPGRSPWTGSRSRHLRPPTFYSISWWRLRGPAASSGVPPLLCAALARLSPFPHVIM